MNGVGYQVPSIGRHAPGAARVLRVPTVGRVVLLRAPGGATELVPPGVWSAT